MPSLSGLGRIWSTMRELDVNAIRQESEQPFALACFGQPALLDTLAHLLYNQQQGANGEATAPARYGAVGADPLYRYPLTTNGAPIDIQKTDMLVLVLDGRQPLSPETVRQLDWISHTTLPFLSVVCYTDRPPILPPESGLSPALVSQMVLLPDPDAPDAAQILATVLLERLPGELHLAAARRLPGLRNAVARELVNSTALSNASYALASGIPEQIPILNLPLAAADILVLTKNQVMMTYKLALVHGAPPDFQAVLREAISVIGLSYIWRQIARTLVGLIPVVGLVPKIAVAYAGTYTVGIAAWQWFATGQVVAQDRLKGIGQDALTRGRELANDLRTRIGKRRQDAAGRVRRVLMRPR